MTIEEIIAKQNNVRVLSVQDYGVHRGRPRRRPSDEEHRLQCACVNWFRYQYPQFASLLFAVPNGGARSKATAGKLKAEGVVAGVSDLILLLPRFGYHALCIEMKTRMGRQSESQKVWQEKVERQCYKYVVCRSLEEFTDIVTDYIDE